jgi:hypothetical protein
MRMPSFFEGQTAHCQQVPKYTKVSNQHPPAYFVNTLPGATVDQSVTELFENHVIPLKSCF